MFILFVAMIVTTDLFNMGYGIFLTRIVRRMKNSNFISQVRAGCQFNMYILLIKMAVSNPLKNMKVSWYYYSQYMEIHKSHVPNHQPDKVFPNSALQIFPLPLLPMKSQAFESKCRMSLVSLPSRLTHNSQWILGITCSQSACTMAIELMVRHSWYWNQVILDQNL